MQEKPVLVFLKTYDKSSEGLQTLLEFFDIDEACVPSFEIGPDPLADSVVVLYSEVPPEAVLPLQTAVSRARACNLDTPEESALCVLSTHPLPDGNKRLAFLLFIAKYIEKYESFPCCRDFKRVLEEWASHLKKEGLDQSYRS